MNMPSPSRHGRQGGVFAEDALEDEDNCGITAYKKDRNQRKKQLHEEVQRALLSSGYPEVAKLRPLFNGELRVDRACAPKSGKECSRHQRTSWREGTLELRRRARNVGKA